MAHFCKIQKVMKGVLSVPFIQCGSRTFTHFKGPNGERKVTYNVTKVSIMPSKLTFFAIKGI